MSEEAVSKWLDEIKLSQYTDMLIKNGLDDLDYIQSINEEILEKIGMVKIVHRHHLLKAVQSLNNTKSKSLSIEMKEGEIEIIQNDNEIKQTDNETKTVNNIRYNQVATSTTYEPVSNTIAHDDVDENEDEYTDVVKKKIYDKKHIVWLFTFILGIYDYITDCEVALSWFSLHRVCPEFRCDVVTNSGVMVVWGVILIIFATVGFIAGFVIKLFEFKKLYLDYTYPIAPKDQLQNEIKLARNSLLCSWITLIFEDLISLFIILIIYMGDDKSDDNDGINEIVGLSSIYLQSMVLSSISICVTLLLSLRNRIKLCEANGRCKYFFTKCWYCVWCPVSGTVATCFILLVFVLAIYKQTSRSPVIDIGKVTSHEKYVNSTCRFYDDHDEMQIDEMQIDEIHVGELTDFPYYVYKNCDGTDYKYNLLCTEDKGFDYEKILSCKLDWFYNLKITDLNDISNISNKTTESYYEYLYDECNSNKNDTCVFTIELGTCSDYTIICENRFTFYEGNPIMYACFDYCKV
eukprot:307202_1